MDSGRGHTRCAAAFGHCALADQARRAGHVRTLQVTGRVAFQIEAWAALTASELPRRIHLSSMLLPLRDWP